MTSPVAKGLPLQARRLFPLGSHNRQVRDSMKKPIMLLFCFASDISKSWVADAQVDE
jgi:hypothetical protein